MTKHRAHQTLRRTDGPDRAASAQHLIVAGRGRGHLTPGRRPLSLLQLREQQEVGPHAAHKISDVPPQNEGPTDCKEKTNKKKKKQVFDESGKSTASL